MSQAGNFVPLEGIIGSNFGPALPESIGHPSSMTVTVEGAARQTLEQARTRLVVVGALFGLALLVVAGKLVDLAIVGSVGAGNQAHVTPPAARVVRADIVDRNGHVLATSIATASLFADPQKILDAPDSARQLASLFPDVTYGEFLQKLQGKNRFVWLRRHLTPRQQYDVTQLGIPGVGFEPDERRLYPQGSEVAQVIGYADIDSHGIAGIEESFDGYLAKGTDPLRLSIDVRLQHMLHREVAAQVAGVLDNSDAEERGEVARGLGVALHAPVECDRGVLADLGPQDLVAARVLFEKLGHVVRDRVHDDELAAVRHLLLKLVHRPLWQVLRCAHSARPAVPTCLACPSNPSTRVSGG